MVSFGPYELSVVLKYLNYGRQSAYESSGSSGRSLSWFLQHEATRSICTHPWMGCQSITGLPPVLNLPVSIDTPGCREAPTERVKCLAQEHKITRVLSLGIREPIDIANDKELNTGLLRQLRLIRVYIFLLFVLFTLYCRGNAVCQLVHRQSPLLPTDSDILSSPCLLTLHVTWLASTHWLLYPQIRHIRELGDKYRQNDINALAEVRTLTKTLRCELSEVNNTKLQFCPGFI